MSKKLYPNGTEIVITRKDLDNNEHIVGLKGKIVGVWNDNGYSCYDVKFNKKFKGGHDLEGKCEYGYGWRIRVNDDCFKIVDKTVKTLGITEFWRKINV